MLMKSRLEPARKWLIFRMLFIGMDVVAGVLCMLPGLRRAPLRSVRRHTGKFTEQ